MPLLAGKEWKECRVCEKDITKKYNASYISDGKDIFIPLCNSCSKKWNKAYKRTIKLFLENEDNE